MKKLLLIAFVAIASINVHAQRKVQFNVDASYLYGLQERTDFGNFSRSDFNMSGASLHLSALYRFSDSFAAGAGIGLDRYNHSGYNTLPIFVKAKYSPLKPCKEAFLFGELGRCIGTSDCTKGTILNTGFGYNLYSKNNFGINVKLGYNINWAEGDFDISTLNESDYAFVSFKDIDHVRHSIFIGVGLEF